jgi:uncharacterized protein (DUF924 family)
MFKNINHEFIDLFCYWYTCSSYTKKINKIKSTDIVNMWTNIWFAKNEKQKIVDIELKQFEHLLLKYKNYESSNIYDYIILIVLYDQIPRNIYRGTNKAYEYDDITKSYLNKVISEFDEFELVFKLTIIIAFVHIENIDIQNMNVVLLYKIKNDPKISEILWYAMKIIINNHKERIELFGRFPERNKFLNRENTLDEQIYLDSLY